MNPSVSASRRILHGSYAARDRKKESGDNARQVAAAQASRAPMQDSPRHRRLNARGKPALNEDAGLRSHRPVIVSVGVDPAPVRIPLVRKQHRDYSAT